MTDDEALDPAIRDRFQTLDDVAVPDTWSAVGMAPITTRPPDRRQRQSFVIAVAVVVLVVGGVLALALSGDERDVAISGSTSGVAATGVPPGTGSPASTALPAGTALPDATLLPAPDAAVAGLLGRAEPAIAKPGTSVTLTPSTIVQRACLDIVTVRSIERRSTVGQITGGASWVPNPVGALPTYPECLGETSANPVVVSIPDLIAGRYVLCLGVDPMPESCALLAIGSDDPAALVYAVADPMAAGPGVTVRVTPTGTISRQCTDIVDVFVEQGGRQRGQILVGADWVPVAPGTAPTVPACEGIMTADALEVVVPPIEPGAYDFCIGSARGGCALVIVVDPGTTPATSVAASVVLPTDSAVASSPGAAPGDTITITPAAVVPRICTDIVKIVADDGSVIGQVYDPATGAWEGPQDDGTFIVPDCLVEPSDAPLTMVVPDIAPGSYRFCVSGELVAASCAAVTVTR